MPIAPTFDPTTGASGGASAPAAGGDDLNAVTWTDVDLTDGSWTETDPDSLASSVSIAAGVNKVTLAELAVGSVNYNWTSGSTQRSPRFHKLLQPDGDQIGSDDFFFLLWRLQFVAPVARAANTIVFGVSEDPTSTSATDIKGLGALLAYPASGNVACGTWTNTSGATSSNPSTVTSLGSFQFAATRGCAGSYAALDASEARVNNSSRNGNLTYSGSTNLSLMVGVGAYNNSATWAAGVDAKFKLQYRIVRLAAL